MSPNDPNSMSELYSAYAAGRLSPAFALMVETQAAIRADIAEDVATSEAIAGSMLEREDKVLLAPNAFERALKAVEAIEADEAAAVSAAKKAGEGINELLALPEPLRARAIEACSDGGWNKMTRGVSRLDLSGNAFVQAHLYRIQPGAGVPQHSHRGDEYTLVVQGGFTDHAGTYGPGDICTQSPTDTHQPVADDDGVCMALVISEGGLKFTGLLGMIQKVLRK
ncbi:cupin domain-containing protein [Henriciella sp. AS95]|uniref:cupin domain-containing protein n=1 Tax=Henriciella sp. AS95 TaxID=3135782 RepID=UPI003174E2C9